MLNGMQLKQNWSESIFKAGYWRGHGFIEKKYWFTIGGQSGGMCGLYSIHNMTLD